MSKQLSLNAYTNPEDLHTFLTAEFPPDATCWSQATDEIRDMARWARKQLGLPESEAVNFRLAKLPSVWNSLGVTGVVAFFTRMNPDQRSEYTSLLRASFPAMFCE
jgi:hypothetical protein